MQFKNIKVALIQAITSGVSRVQKIYLKLFIFLWLMTVTPDKIYQFIKLQCKNMNLFVINYHFHISSQNTKPKYLQTKCIINLIVTAYLATSITIYIICNTQEGESNSKHKKNKLITLSKKLKYSKLAKLQQGINVSNR